MPASKGNSAIGWRGDPPAVVGAHSGPLLVMGSGHTLPADLAAYDQTHTGARMAINRVGLDYRGHLDHWATLHPERNVHLLAIRLQLIDAYETPLHSHRPVEGVRRVWRIDNVGGTSGLFGVIIGLLMGYRPIVIAGMPLDGGGHYYDLAPVSEQVWRYDDRSTTLVWRHLIETMFAGRVSALSGRTREWLGGPAALERQAMEA